jgi:thiol-disulfide isomerase/thioredoxin
MRWLLVPLCLLASLTIGVVPAEGLPATPVDQGMLFGGQWSPAGNASASVTHNFSDLPAVVEVFTATWCENCVDVEHALDDVQDLGFLQQYHVHRAIGETQDPFGTVELDQRWRDKYGLSSPPAVVFNGTMKKIGSVADDGTLVNEFSNLAKRDLGLGQGSTSFAWTPTSESAGTVAWHLDIDAAHLENSTLNVSIFVVESAADFEEGTNGLGTYPHIIHNIQVVGHELQGTGTVALPTAFDGDDLEVHLIYEIIPNAPVPSEQETPIQDEPEGEDTPGFSAILTMMTASLAVIHRRRKDRSSPL